MIGFTDRDDRCRSHQKTKDNKPCLQDGCDIYTHSKVGYCADHSGPIYRKLKKEKAAAKIREEVREEVHAENRLARTKADIVAVIDFVKYCVETLGDEGFEAADDAQLEVMRNQYSERALADDSERAIPS